MLKTAIFIVSCFAPFVASAQEKTFTLNAPPRLVESGFMKHLLPRFSLKKGIRVVISDENPVAAIGAEGTPVFREGDRVWYFQSVQSANTDAFKDWLLSDVGKRTIEAFGPEGSPMFSADIEVEATLESVAFTGDVALGESVSLGKCGRCHVVNDTNRMKAIGSTPSFALLRGFEDWENRFQAFYALKPHGAFTQVEDVTEPFPENLPSPIAPIEVTLDEIDAITAFVAQMPPADLGAALQSR